LNDAIRKLIARVESEQAKIEEFEDQTIPALQQEIVDERRLKEEKGAEN
jgi:hypothetical protein